MNRSRDQMLEARLARISDLKKIMENAKAELMMLIGIKDDVEDEN